jgi:hypothetical protein
MLSPDNYVQIPDNAQNHNRYSYCLNNPLKYTDPSGYVFAIDDLIFWGAIAISAYLGGVAANQGEFNFIEWNYSSWQTYTGMAVGGLAGWAGASIGMAVNASAMAGGATALEASMASGMMGGMLSGGITSAGMAAVFGGNIGDILGGMAQGVAVGGFSGLISGTVFQGVNNLFSNTLMGGLIRDYMPVNTLSYMAASTTSQMTANLMCGNGLFAGLNYGFNVGIILPLALDVAPYIKSFNTHVAQKYSKNKNFTRTDKVQIRLADNGDLQVNQTLYRDEPYPDIDYIAEYGNIWNNPRIEILALYNKIFSPNRTHTDFWFISNQPFIYNYRGVLQTLYIRYGR